MLKVSYIEWVGGELYRDIVFPSPSDSKTEQDLITRGYSGG